MCTARLGKNSAGRKTAPFRNERVDQPRAPDQYGKSILWTPSSKNRGDRQHEQRQTRASATLLSAPREAHPGIGAITATITGLMPHSSARQPDRAAADVRIASASVSRNVSAE